MPRRAARRKTNTMHRPPRSQLARPLTVAAALAALTPAAGPPAAASPGSVPHCLALAGIDRAGLARALGATLRADVDVLNNTSLHTDNFLGLWVAQDLDDPSRYAPFLLQGGLGMPDRDYYLGESAKMAEVRNRYQAHIAAVLTLAHLTDAAGAAARIFELERRMAQVHSSRAESEEVLKGNNHWARQDFAQRAPGLDWQAFLGAA